MFTKVHPIKNAIEKTQVGTEHLRGLTSSAPLNCTWAKSDLHIQHEYFISSAHGSNTVVWTEP